MLVGGHAALAWAAVYGVRHAFTTDDLDWHTTDRRAPGVYAERLGAAATLREATDGGFHLAVVNVEDDVGTPRTVDFISGVHGVAHSEQLEQKAVELDIGGIKLRVLHPVHVLCSKVANLNLPGRGRGMDVAQARVAVHVVGAFAHDVARQDPRAARRLAQRVYELAKTEAARDARVRHGVDVYAAIEPWPEMDPDFREHYYVRCRERLDAAHEARVQRLSEGSVG